MHRYQRHGRLELRTGWGYRCGRKQAQRSSLAKSHREIMECRDSAGSLLRHRPSGLLSGIASQAIAAAAAAGPGDTDLRCGCSAVVVRPLGRRRQKPVSNSDFGAGTWTRTLHHAVNRSAPFVQK